MLGWLKGKLKEQKEIACKSRGLAEKNEATRMKIEVASRILDRRVTDRPVSEERRISNGETKEKWMEYVRRYS